MSKVFVLMTWALYETVTEMNFGTRPAMIWPRGGR